MNKYQEALHYFEKYIGVTDNPVTNQLVEEYAHILNELIDKETPIKPINQFKVDLGLGNVGNCVCGAEVNYQQIYCDKCGQKIDWSNEE